MTQIIIMAAVAQNGVIGLKNRIPWHVSEDWRRLKKLSLGHPCLMGRVTYESLPANARPLPDRENIILTSKRDYHPENTTVFSSFDQAIKYARAKNATKTFIMGGASIYQMGLAVADILEITRIHKDFAGDAFFPEVDWNLWELSRQENHDTVNKINGDTLSISFLTYHRKNSH